MSTMIHLRYVVGWAFVVAFAANVPAQPVDFGRDVRPILSDHCFACHGPDEEHREADLRLDASVGVLSVVQPEQVDQSELISRILSDDADTLMPPPKFGKPLSQAQIEILKQWVAQGATYGEHWAFETPQKKSVPAVAMPSATEAIDAFIDAELRRIGLPPNAAADRRTLLRRVSLDLTGLPPSQRDAEQFLNDTSAEAYERLVDRLLQSHHYGEHMARYWLDLVRYGDTHGLHLDNFREMWLYRDWVIDAFNENMPMDQFITEQLAGDLLPEATVSQKIASGFNRLNVSTNEGGSIVEEVFARNVIDRTDAFGTIFLGLTTGCSVCHDHKFDPITAADYYSLSAFFNSLDGKAMDGNIKDSPPSIQVGTPEQLKEVAEFDQAIKEIRQQMEGPLETVDQAQLIWESSLGTTPKSEWTQLTPATATSEANVEMRIREDQAVEVAGKVAAKDTTTIEMPLPANEPWKALRLEVLTDTPEQRAGLASNGNAVLSEIVVEMQHGDDPTQWIPVPIRAAIADIEQPGGSFAVKYAIDGKLTPSEGWAIGGHQQTGSRTAWFDLGTLFSETAAAKLRVQLKYQSQFAQHQFRAVRFSLSTTMPSTPESHRVQRGPIHSVGPFPVATTELSYEQTFASQAAAFDAKETFLYEDRNFEWQQRDDLSEVVVNTLATVADQGSVNLLHQTVTSPTAQKITLLLGTSDGHVVYLNGKQIGISQGAQELDPLGKELELDLKAGDNELYIKVVNHDGPSLISFAYRSPVVEVSPSLAALVKTPPADRLPADRDALRKYYRSVYCSHPDWLVLVDQEKGMMAAAEKIRSEFPSTLIWKELETPRQAHIMLRGAYDQLGAAVPRATPAFLPPMDESDPKDRLGLAKWLLADEHPLTSRVAVNRFWQQVFGTGIVKTSEDFGSQGQQPSHPDLLDWLAVDFREQGWDIKRLMKSIVMSDAYQRSARSEPIHQKLDPGNRLLARGPRFRLDGEMLRDQSLALSGLLVDQMGGPSVKPPQPDGLWLAVGYSGSNTVRFKADEGNKIYRRSVYTFWKRTSAPPQFSTFDAPSRESCIARRERTNTPLQALLLMNETQFLESAKQLGKQVAEQTELPTLDEKIQWVFQRVTLRPPSPQETNELAGLVEDLLLHYADQPQAAEKLVGTSSAETAAWTMLCSTLLNLDEVLNK
ncbi:Planctomycete cytochrome C [Novipirellula galeiformis]|uniref:Planctomycete cytochrome C n=1 Tax=Novipirellula galeiformis TaxID=2528004 RepID=A0A5C6BTJ4_9BACT|nr:PSD1 and planctomycete cytochrome C domain-containing protein [Novipirellula galeiformis]TWU14987.1 Planctomycete cytochrome C [Novipirellula galeiformis]